MKIKWLGHACFLITSEEGTRIIIDPYVPGHLDIEYGKIEEEADIVVISHNHGGHNNAAAIKGSPVVIKGVGFGSISRIVNGTKKELEMHEEAPPHCGCCVRFHGCLVVDMVMSWGYCDAKVKSQPLSSEQIQHIDDETKSGNYEIIYALEKDGVLFMPSFDIAMECPKYWDYQWGPSPDN